MLKKFAQLKLEEKPINQLDPYKLDDGILLIPDRWTKGGWKYTTKEPVSSPFFNKPNRVNGQGFAYRENGKISMSNGQKYGGARTKLPGIATKNGFGNGTIVNFPAQMTKSSFGMIGQRLA